MKPTNDDASPWTGLPGEVTGLTGTLPSGNVIIIASRYNAEVCNSMARAAVETLMRAGIAQEDIHIHRVPGAWELPLATQTAIAKSKTIGAVVLGAVIRGETTHDEHINRAVSMAIMDLTLSTGKPIGFGLLTCNTQEQAIARAGGDVGNKGAEAAEAMIEMLRLASNQRQARKA